jgi:probable F420-dependent oxidoreductase
MRFGLALPHYDTSFEGRPASWEAVRDVARLAERSGFDSVWVSDHLFLDWSKYGGPDTRQGCLECWTTMTALAATTERIRIGSMALCNDFRAPALVAKMAASLDLLSGGRVDLGLGAGWYEPEYVAAGIPYDPPGTRIRRLGESVEIVKRLLAGEELTYEGKFYDIRGAVLNPGPRQSPLPVWVGGKGDYLISTAARVADGWNMSWLTGADAYKERLDHARKACEKHGRDFETFRRSAGVYVTVGRDERDARGRYERLVERSPKGVLPSSNGSAAVSWQEFRSDRIAGTAGEVIDKLGALAELGVEEVILGLGVLPFQLSDAEDVELVGAEVIPALR